MANFPIENRVKLTYNIGEVMMWPNFVCHAGMKSTKPITRKKRMC